MGAKFLGGEVEKKLMYQIELLFIAVSHAGSERRIKTAKF